MFQATDGCWLPAQDQGTEQVALLLQDLLSADKGVKWEIREDPTHKSHTLWCSDAVVAKTASLVFPALVNLIDLLTPCGGDFVGPERHGQLRLLQRLIFSNLGCVEPPLEPYDG